VGAGLHAERATAASSTICGATPRSIRGKALAPLYPDSVLRAIAPVGLRANSRERVRGLYGRPASLCGSRTRSARRLLEGSSPARSMPLPAPFSPALRAAGSGPHTRRKAHESHGRPRGTPRQAGVGAKHREIADAVATGRAKHRRSSMLRPYTYRRAVRARTHSGGGRSESSDSAHARGREAPRDRSSFRPARQSVRAAGAAAAWRPDGAEPDRRRDGLRPGARMAPSRTGGETGCGSGQVWPSEGRRALPLCRLSTRLHSHLRESRS